jgi:hypothetical protein
MLPRNHAWHGICSNSTYCANFKKSFFKYLGLDNIFKTYTIPKILHYDTFHAWHNIAIHGIIPNFLQYDTFHTWHCNSPHVTIIQIFIFFYYDKFHAWHILRNFGIMIQIVFFLLLWHKLCLTQIPKLWYNDPKVFSSQNILCVYSPHNLYYAYTLLIKHTMRILCVYRVHD